MVPPSPYPTGLWSILMTIAVASLCCTAIANPRTHGLWSPANGKRGRRRRAQQLLRAHLADRHYPWGLGPKETSLRLRLLRHRTQQMAPETAQGLRQSSHQYRLCQLEALPRSSGKGYVLSVSATARLLNFGFEKILVLGMGIDPLRSESMPTNQTTDTLR